MISELVHRLHHASDWLVSRSLVIAQDSCLALAVGCACHQGLPAGGFQRLPTYKACPAAWLLCVARLASEPAPKKLCRTLAAGLSMSQCSTGGSTGQQVALHACQLEQGPVLSGLASFRGQVGMTSGLHLSCLCCLQTALKSLMTMHRLMRESDISFLEEVCHAPCSHSCTLFGLLSALLNEAAGHKQAVSASSSAPAAGLLP